MAYETKYTTSVHGRRLGLQRMTTPETGSGNGKADFLVGAEDVRKVHSTAETTATNLKAYGYSVLTTAVSSGVYTIDPPIPGVSKVLVFNTTGANPIYVKTGGETISSTQTTTASIIVSSQTAYASVTLIPVSTAIWAVANSVSSGYLRIQGTT